MTSAFDHPPVLHDLVPLLFAAAIGCGIGITYMLAQGPQSASIRIANACIILTIVICLITRVVDDLATAFIVVGALALVRMRAAIEDTHEFGFLLLAVAAGLGAGERRYEIVVCGVLLVCMLALFLAPPRDSRFGHRVTLTVPASALDEVRAAIGEVGSDHAIRLRDVGDGRTTVRADFVAAPEAAERLVERLRGLPMMTDLGYDSQAAGERR